MYKGSVQPVQPQSDQSMRCFDEESLGPEHLAKTGLGAKDFSSHKCSQYHIIGFPLALLNFSTTIAYQYLP